MSLSIPVAMEKPGVQKIENLILNCLYFYIGCFSFDNAMLKRTSNNVSHIFITRKLFGCVLRRERERDTML